MSHARIYDDGQVRAVIHPGCIVIPTTLAVAEYIGKVAAEIALQLLYWRGPDGEDGNGS